MSAPNHIVSVPVHVTALRPGTKGTVLVASAAQPTVTQLVPVTTRTPRVPQPIFFSDLRTGTPSVAADLSALRGTITAVGEPTVPGCSAQPAGVVVTRRQATTPANP